MCSARKSHIFAQSCSWLMMPVRVRNSTLPCSNPKLFAPHYFIFPDSLILQDILIIILLSYYPVFYLLKEGVKLTVLFLREPTLWPPFLHPFLSLLSSCQAERRSAGRQRFSSRPSPHLALTHISAHPSARQQLSARFNAPDSSSGS